MNGNYVFNQDLTFTETRLLEFMDTYNGKPVSREEILSEVWENLFTRVVDVYIGYLRRKLTSHSIISHRGFGYQLVPKSEDMVSGNASFFGGDK